MVTSPLSERRAILIGESMLVDGGSVREWGREDPLTTKLTRITQ